ncbi:hypothetical protein O0I10_006185 [Lichtheimia ornata]|uniref:F-box domain-containing protein n=1 Tax=Lichtheimia ornata TaxID=688661 RepID=A0AAD7XZ31_9FUNG|nr:uncharacterized protein O0I10_006185 [Lichtheimia ornata]KAJ8658178.1 hypothetical protein O0I10_006185 [Lichtheimia ornata]
MQLHWLSNTESSTRLPPELINTILNYMPRCDLYQAALVSKVWYAHVMPRLYAHVCICTGFDWVCFVRTVLQREHFQFGASVRSLVLKPSPALAPSRQFQHRGAPRGYTLAEGIDRERTGLEEMTSNYPEIDTTTKEAEWLNKMVSQREMQAVLARFPQLEYLDVSGCEQLGDLPFPSTLQGAWLSLVRGLSSDGLLALTHATDLVHLDLSFCLQIDDQAFTKAIRHWPHLTHVRLNSLYGLTDTSIIALANNCPNLELLHLVRCWQVSNTALFTLVEHCPKLEYVSVAYLGRADEQGVGSLVVRLAKLKWIDITGCGINTLLKPMFTENWNKTREQQQWDPVEYRDVTIALI